MEDGPEKHVTQTESTIRWTNHEKVHDKSDREVEKEIKALKEIVAMTIENHREVHDIHAQAHEREHEMHSEAIIKAEEAMVRRLEGMNQFREQLNSQTQSFLTREVFEKYTKDFDAKMDLALNGILDKNEGNLRSIANRHEADFNSLRELIQSEKEIRKAFEGSINTWKWLAGFLGASGVAGVILLFATGG